jgi:hypothetical protein
MRHVETRYRLLFQLSSDGILVVDATTHKVLDANSAAGQILMSAGTANREPRTANCEPRITRITRMTRIVRCGEWRRSDNAGDELMGWGLVDGAEFGAPFRKG